MEQKALKCMEIDRTLLYKQLPAHMIVTNFIAGEDDCNYEIYIREFINESSYFLALSNGQRYEAPQSESNKEPDAISDRYKLDFKLMVATSRMEANSILSGSITKYGERKEDEKDHLLDPAKETDKGETLRTVLFDVSVLYGVQWVQLTVKKKSNLTSRR